MSRTQKVSKTPPPVLNRDYWLRFGGNPEPSMRDRLIFATVGEIGRRGPLDTNARWVCDLVGVKYPMVNYYFGSWDGLLAEAIWYAYDQWYNVQIASVMKPAKNARDRLRRLIEDEIARSQRLGGIIPLSAYPVLSESVGELLRNDPLQKVEKMTEWTLGVLAILIRDLRTGGRTEIDFTPYDVNRASFMLSMPKELVAAASALWSISGMTMWVSSSATMGRSLRDLPAKLSEHAAIKSHVERLIDSLERA